MNVADTVFVAGSRGMVGSAIVRKLKSLGYRNILAPSSAELNLLRQVDVEKYFEENQPQYVFLAAAKVGGIVANQTYPAEFIHDNILIQSNVIGVSHQAKVRKLLFMGSSCIYPKFAKQPIAEGELLTGPLESTNRPYAIAKIAGVEMCRSYFNQYGDKFISVMPTNLYGINDSYDLNNSHVIPGMIAKFHAAKISNKVSVQLWGTGTPLREFLYSEDLAEACVFAMKEYEQPEILNIGSGTEITIFDLATKISSVVGFKGQIDFDREKPDGTPRKFLDSSRIHAMGWRSSTTLDDGLLRAYRDFLSGSQHTPKY